MINSTPSRAQRLAQIRTQLAQLEAELASILDPLANEHTQQTRQRLQHLEPGWVPRSLPGHKPDGASS